MSSDLVKKWFGNTFEELHPLLQQLHREGGKLSGDVDVCYGRGLAGWIGKRLARKMGIAGAGLHRLKVVISHDDHCLYWQRCFGDGSLFTSCFRPLGTFNDGCWVESSGSMSLFLAVEIKQGGWYWSCQKVSMFGVTLPSWLSPKFNAYKTIVDSQYHFYVELCLPIVGRLLCYQGALNKAQS